MNEPLLSVVIVTWESLELLKRCLSMLPAALAGVRGEVVIVDNGSSDGTGCWLAAGGPGRVTSMPVKYYLNPGNWGVARARNQGVCLGTGRYLCLLDVDTEPQAGALGKLVALLDKDPDAGLVGPKLIHPDGTLQYSCRRFPGLGDKLGRRLPAWLVPGLARRACEAELRFWDHAGVREVDYVIGACQLIRRAALDDVGLLDERIFYGPEDVDICLRLWRRGWRVVYLPDALVIHHERRLTRRLWSTLTLRHIAGLAYYFGKHGYLFRAPAVRPADKRREGRLEAEGRTVA